MAKNKQLSAKMLAHVTKHEKKVGLTATAKLPDFKSVLLGGTSKLPEGGCQIKVAIQPKKDNPDIGHNAKLVDDQGQEHFLTFISDEADASVSPGKYALDWVVTGMPETTFTVDVTGDITKETHRGGTIPKAGFTGASFTVEAVQP